MKNVELNIKTTQNTHFNETAGELAGLGIAVGRIIPEVTSTTQ